MQSNASSDVANIFGDTRGSLRAHLPRFVDLVSDLAANVAKESSDSSVQFIGHLNQIEETLIAERRKSEESIQHLGNLEQVIIENGEDQEALKQNMQKAIDVGAFVRNEIEQSRQAISSIAISIDGVKQELSEIVNFSRQIKMIAINASIASARAGAAGREFSVISSEVRRLASETESVIDRLGPLVQGAIKELKSHSVTSRCTAAEGEDDVLQRLDDQKETLDIAANSLVELNSDYRELLSLNFKQQQDKKTVQEQIERSIRQAISDAQTGDVIRQQAETIEEMLRDLRAFIASSDVSTDVRAGIEELISRTSGKYVMHSQRRVHSEGGHKLNAEQTGDDAIKRFELF